MRRRPRAIAKCLDTSIDDPCGNVPCARNRVGRPILAAAGLQPARRLERRRQAKLPAPQQACNLRLGARFLESVVLAKRELLAKRASTATSKTSLGDVG